MVKIKKKKKTFDNQPNGAAFLFNKYSAGKQSMITQSFCQLTITYTSPKTLW